ncbi:MAG TPA: AI-2E family transporter, partial [Solirubrobacteraceae bacterium]|nr:AI-2E family transporter [Solirubrobacteraceae bacterium]
PASARDVDAARPANVAPPEVVVVSRWIQLVLLPLSLLGLWALARAAGSVLLVFLVAGVAALMLNPLVKVLERLKLPRGLAVLAIFLCFLLAFAGIGIALANPVSHQVKRFQRDLPGFVNSANNSIASFQTWLNDNGIKVQITQPGKTALQSLQSKVLKGSGSLLSFTSNILQQVVTAAFALILIIVLTVYMLIYSDRIGALVRSALPRGDGTPEDDFPLRAQRAVFNYVRGQLLFSLIMGSSTALALWIFGVLGIFPDGQRYALFFGIFYGLMELIPYVGPILGAAPPLILALINDPLSAVWLVLLFVSLQQIEGHVVAPQVFGKSLRINPLIVILALLLGGQLYGLPGALLSLPIAAIVRETVIYLRRHLVLEPWGTPSAEAILARRAATPRAGVLGAGATAPMLRCGECGAAVDDGDARCHACGSPLEPEAPTRG